ncbi:MAG: SET domain-containing protein-lysine N-methyltransferase [Hyphomicrobiaceae bacterium]|nr:SET domain-containing protein-lysine N-methyltransferase [Hyphomicrobiaceae bacterium]
MDHRFSVESVSGMGRGVFARCAIVAGEVLGTFHTIHVPAAEVNAGAASTLAHYWFLDDADGSAFVVLGFIELLNHSRRPNLERRWLLTETGWQVELFALRAIEPGEQLMIDYRFAGDADDPAWA